MATAQVQQMVDPHDVVMTGENSFIRLSKDGGKSLATRASHWRVLWSPAGQGHVLFLETKSIRVLSDNAGMTRYLQKHIEKLLHEPFADPSLPATDRDRSALLDFVRAGGTVLASGRLGAEIVPGGSIAGWSPGSDAWSVFRPRMPSGRRKRWPRPDFRPRWPRPAYRPTAG